MIGIGDKRIMEKEWTINEAKIFSTPRVHMFNTARDPNRCPGEKGGKLIVCLR